MISYEPLLRTLEWKDIGLTELVDLCGLSSRTVAKIRKGESLTASTLDRICVKLEVPIHEVIEIVHPRIVRSLHITNGLRAKRKVNKYLA